MNKALTLRELFRYLQSGTGVSLYEYAERKYLGYDIVTDYNYDELFEEFLDCEVVIIEATNNSVINVDIVAEWLESEVKQ